MNLGVWQLVIIALVILVLFGRGKISEMMGDFGKGIKSFKQGISDEDDRDVPLLDNRQGGESGASREKQEAEKQA